MADENEVQEEKLKDTEPQFSQLGRLFKAIKDGKVKPGITHAVASQEAEVEAGPSNQMTYLVGFEGSGRGSTRVLLWEGSASELITGLLKAVGARQSGSTYQDIDEL